MKFLHRGNQHGQIFENGRSREKRRLRTIYQEGKVALSRTRQQRSIFSRQSDDGGGGGGGGLEIISLYVS